MQTPRGAPLINSPPVINGGDVREDVAPRERFAGSESEQDAGKDDERVSSPRQKDKEEKPCLSERSERETVSYILFLFEINFHHLSCDDKQTL